LARRVNFGEHVFGLGLPPNKGGWGGCILRVLLIQIIKHKIQFNDN